MRYYFKGRRIDEGTFKRYSNLRNLKEYLSKVPSSRRGKRGSPPPRPARPPVVSRRPTPPRGRRKKPAPPPAPPKRRPAPKKPVPPSPAPKRRPPKKPRPAAPPKRRKKPAPPPPPPKRRPPRKRRPTDDELHRRLALLFLELRGVERDIAQVKRDLAELTRKEQNVFDAMKDKNYKGLPPLRQEPGIQQQIWDSWQMADLDDEARYSSVAPDDEDFEPGGVHEREVTRLIIVFQRDAVPSDPKEIQVGFREQRRKLVNKKRFIKFNLPLGYEEAGLDWLKLYTARYVMQRAPAQEAGKPPYDKFYAIAEITDRREDSSGRVRKTTFFRTIVPRTEIYI